MGNHMNLSILIQYLAKTQHLDFSELTKKIKENITTKYDAVKKKEAPVETKAEEMSVSKEDSSTLPQEVLIEMEQLAVQPSLTKKERNLLEQLVVTHEDCARHLIKTLPEEAQAILLSALFKQGMGEDLAEEIARASASALVFETDRPEEKDAMIQWLSSQASPIPAHLPQHCKGSAFVKDIALYCQMDKVHPFPERLWYYGALSDNQEITRTLMKEIVRNDGIEAASEFFTKICSTYPFNKEMQIISIANLMIAPHKLKKESEFYESLLKGWQEANPEEFEAAILKMDEAKQAKLKRNLNVAA